MQEELTIEKAEKFFLDRDTRSAGHMAGLLLEQSVEDLCAFHQIPLSNAPNTRDLLDRLLDVRAISWEEKQELQHLVTIRNQCDHLRHHATPVTREEVQKLIQGTKKFKRRVESQSSTAPARPFVTQHSTRPVPASPTPVSPTFFRTSQQLQPRMATKPLAKASPPRAGSECGQTCLGILITVVAFWLIWLLVLCLLALVSHP